MATRLDRPAIRGSIITILLLLIVGFLVWGGTMTPDPSLNNFPGGNEVGPNPERYVGDRVTLDGSVVSTDPVVIEVTYDLDATRRVTLHQFDESVEPGQRVTAFGFLTDRSTLTVERGLVQSSWERYVMYGISALAGLWVLTRLLRHWHLDVSTLTVRPRGDRDA